MMLEIPKPEDLRKLPLVEKPSTVGLVAWWFIGLLQLGTLLRIEAARQAFEDYKQECEGRLYWFPGIRSGGPYKGTPGTPPSASLRNHESVHDWQRRTFGRLFYWTSYGNVFDRTNCAHLEAAACGYQVAFDGRLAEERAQTLKNGPYFFGRRWPVERLTSLIEDYADKYRVENAEASHALGTTPEVA